ncbi:SpoIID/LytB domain-containing protein [Radiobacillus kanasensis]|uniref:SpoIID/LytB domain-containing protein n=1 Tax=Radiobacillus kanasensis TaxID=2844358 RepID=UPI001E56F623|nr:SpoIID/LytB domain-containing protein [Radiobacillus kanasensis]UFU00199.1 SpoIID/LytB domain-containing protein [Radiobacillus kanasensis]
MKKILLITVLLIGLFPITSEAEEMVTVRLTNYIEDSSKLNVEFKGAYRSLDPTLAIKEGVNYQLTVDEDSLILQGENGQHTFKEPLIFIPEKYDEKHILYINGRPYLGAMEFRVEEDDTIRPVNQLPMEDYLKGVVPFEVYPSWGLEALKAQALAARTYATSHLNEEIDDTISYQVYGGYTWKEKTTKAVEETSGEVITYKGKLIEAFYSASNGGVTENNAHVWGGKSKPYFPIKKDPYDPIEPWGFTLHRTQIDLKAIDWDIPNWWEVLEEKDKKITESMKRYLKRKGYWGDLKILAIPNFTVSDKQLSSKRSVKGSITIEFMERLFGGTVLFHQYHLDGVNLNRIRPLIGGTIFKSYLINSFQSKENSYTMKGKGFGHGVGMSQWGAQAMAESGKSYKEIIQFYFPGTRISEFKK